MTRLVQPIPPMHSQENALKLQIWLVSLSQNTFKMGEINRPCPKCKQLKMQPGYICMSNSKSFLPCILKKFVKNPKFDLFHKVKILPKFRKSTDHGQNVISSQGGQDTSACQSAGPSSFAFSRKYLEVASLACFTSQNDAKMRKINRRWPKSYQFWSGQDTSTCQISAHSKWLQ